MQSADQVLSGAQPGVWDRDTTGSAVVVPGSHAPLIMEGHLYRTNVRPHTNPVSSPEVTTLNL